jgi:SPP1 gp7 family putative phage head morphogenesis protein
VIGTSSTTANGGRDRLGAPFKLNGNTRAGREWMHVSVPTRGADGAVGKSWDVTFAQHLRLQLGGADDLQRPLEENPWLHACAAVMATAVASVPLRIYSHAPGAAGDDDSGVEVTSEDDPIYRLLHQPNRFDVWSDIAKRGVFHRFGNGEDWLFLADEAGKPVAKNQSGKIQTPVQIIQASGACVVDTGTDEYGMPKGWRYSAQGRQAPDYPVESVLSFLDPDPYNRFRGLGPAEVLARELGQYFQAQRYIEGLARNGGEFGGVLSTPPGIGDQEVDAIQARLNDHITNGEKRGQYVVLPNTMTFTPNGIAPKDMEFRALFEWVREAIAAACHVPLPVIGVYTDATYNNVKTAHAEFWRTGVIPYLKSIEAVLNQKFFPRLAEAKLAGYRVFFDVSDIDALREDNTLKIDSALRNAALLSWPPNPLLALYNVDAELKGGDVAPRDPFAFGAETDDDEDESDNGGGDNEDEGSDDSEADTKTAPATLTRAGAPLQERGQRVDYWLAKEKRLRIPAERRLLKPGLTFLRKYEQAQLTRLRAFARAGKRLSAFAAYEAKDIAVGDEAELARQVEILLLNKKEWEDKLAALFEQPLRNVAAAALKDAAMETGGISIGVGNPRMVDALSRQTLQLAEGATSTIATRLRTRLMDELSKATSIGDLQERVKEVLPELEGTVKEAFATRDQRALTIARTEAGHAIGKSRFEQFKADGVEALQWITQGDGEVRPSHAAIDGQVVPLGSSFPNGLRYAHDENAPAEETINCRCDSLPVMGDA